jgi:large-conductance mechanosensitive channel
MKIPDSSEFENIIITDSLSDSDSSTNNYYYQKVKKLSKENFFIKDKELILCLKSKFYCMKITSFLSLVFVVFLNVLFSNAQETGFACGHSEMQKKLFNENPNLKLEYDKLSEIARNYTFDNNKKRGGKYIIPVVFHILHQNGVENITDEQVLDQMAILNKDFNKLNADTADIHPAFKDLIASIVTNILQPLVIKILSLTSLNNYYDLSPFISQQKNALDISIFFSALFTFIFTVITVYYISKFISFI